LSRQTEGDCYLKNSQPKKRAGGVVQVVGTCKHKALTSNFSTTKKKVLCKNAAKAPLVNVLFSCFCMIYTKSQISKS
jgi:hypothetical protein